MKFANYTFYSRSVNNLGDNMQLIAIDLIYEKMGIPKKDIVYIDKNQTSTYKGEYVILPVNLPLVDYAEHGICGHFSDHIIPVFLGLTLLKDSLRPEEITFYHRYEPIGCRDERTMKTLRKYGVQAYLHGCLTALLPNRNSGDKKFDKVFIVDAPQELLSYIPQKLLEDAEFLTHRHEEVDDPKKLMHSYYQRYKNEAKLVITGLLHCSVPCIAAGIPVILARNSISYRFEWLDKLLPIYERKDFPYIDWDPLAISYEDHKENLLHLTMDRLRNTYEKNKSIYDSSWFYETREKKDYLVDGLEELKQFINSRFIDRSIEYKYSIWGLTQISELVVNYISDNFPNAKLSHVYDKHRKVFFEGIQSESPEDICNYPDEIVFVTAHGAVGMAQSYFDGIGRNKKNYYLWNPAI